jgi:histidinol phosphatase-like enzyme (inositol monophosphatase family)
MDDALRERWQHAWAIAWEGGLNTLRYFQRADVDYQRKADKSPVTIADRDTEQLLRRRILERFPQDGILGEEFGTVDGSSGFRWILDPIDGTKAFIGGVPLYGTMVGLERDAECVVGAVVIPALQEGIHACVGQGAWHYQAPAPAGLPVDWSPEGQPLLEPPLAERRARVSAVASLRDALLAAAEPRTFQKRGALETLMELDSRVYVSRNWGDCFGYLLVATGRVEVMIDPIMSVWDAAAVLPILTEAGGTFTDWNGEATIHHQEGLATNGQVLAEVLEVTRRAARAVAN